MNRIVKLFVVSSLLTISLQAQTVEEKIKKEVLIKADTIEVSYENKLRPAIGYISDISAKDIKKHWKSFLSKTYKISSKFNGNVVMSKDIVINSLSDKRIDLYLSADENGTGSKVKFFVAFGYDIYVDPNIYGKEFASLKKIADNFLYESTNIFFNEKTNGFSKQMASLVSKNSKLLKGINKNNASIESGKVTIASLSDVDENDSKASVKAKKKILKLNKKIIAKTIEIEDDKNKIEANKKEIELLKKDLAYYKKRKELLKR